MRKLINLAIIFNTLNTLKNMTPANERGPLLLLISKVQLLEEGIQKELTPILNKPKNDDRAKQYFDACQKHTDDLQKLIDHELQALIHKIELNSSGALSSGYSRGLIEQLKNNLHTYLETFKKLQLNYNNIKDTFDFATRIGDITSLLGGVVLPMDQTIDPLMGGYIDDAGKVKASDGNCAGKSLKHIKQYTEQGHATYPILADHEVQQYQKNQLDTRDAMCFKVVEDASFLDFDFKAWLQKIPAGDSFYLALQRNAAVGHAVDLCKRYDNTFDFFDSNSGHHFIRTDAAMAYLLRKVIISYRQTESYYVTLNFYRSKQPIKNSDVAHFPMPAIYDASLLAHSPQEREAELLQGVEDSISHYGDVCSPNEALERGITYYLELLALTEFAELPETLARLATLVDEVLAKPDTEKVGAFRLNNLRAACQKNPICVEKLTALKKIIAEKRAQSAPVASSKAHECLAGIEVMKNKLQALMLEKCSIVKGFVDLPGELTDEQEEALLTEKRQMLVLQIYFNKLNNSDLFNRVRNALSKNSTLPFDFEKFKTDLDALLPNASSVLLKNSEDIEQFVVDSLKTELTTTVSHVQTDAVDVLLAQIANSRDAIGDPDQNATNFITITAINRQEIQKKALTELLTVIDNKKTEWLDGSLSFDELCQQIKMVSHDVITLSLAPDADFDDEIAAFNAATVKDLPQLPDNLMQQLNGIYQLLTNETETGLIAMLNKQFDTSLKNIGNQTLFACIRTHMQRQIKLIKESLTELTNPQSLCSQDGVEVAGRIIETFHNHFGAILNSDFTVSAVKMAETVTHLAKNNRYQHVFDILLSELKDLVSNNENLLAELAAKFSGCKNILVYNALHQFICARHEALVERVKMAMALRENFLRLGGVGVSTLIERMKSVFSGTNIDFMNCSDAQIVDVARRYYNNAIYDNKAFATAEKKLVNFVVAGQLSIQPIVSYIDNETKESKELFGASVSCDYPLLSQRNLSHIRLKALAEPFRTANHEMNTAKTVEEKAFALLNIPAYLVFYNRDFLELNEQHHKQCQKSTNKLLLDYKEYALMLQRSNLHNLIEHVLQLIKQHQDSHGHVPGIATIKFKSLISDLTQQLKTAREIHSRQQPDAESGLLTKENMMLLASDVNRIVGAEIMDQFGLVPGYKALLTTSLENKFAKDCNNPLQSFKDSAWGVSFGALIKMGAGVASKATNSTAVEEANEFRYTQ